MTEANARDDLDSYAGITRIRFSGPRRTAGALSARFARAPDGLAWWSVVQNGEERNGRQAHEVFTVVTKNRHS